LETLDAAVYDFNQETIDAEDLLRVINTITDVTQGLVPYEVTDLILKVRKGL
jgi:hypothetical protein